MEEKEFSKGINRKEYLGRWGVTAVKVPMPLVVPNANVFFIDGEVPILIDAGFSSPGSMDVIREGLKETGREIEDVGLILLTHGHRDHFGMADEIKKLSGARVLLNGADFDILKKGSFAGYLDRVTDFYKELGVGDKSLKFHLEFSKYDSRAFGHETIVPDGALSEGDRFATGAGRITVFETPGHTEGSVSFYLEEAGILFSGDLLSALYDPPPLVMVERDGVGWMSHYEIYMRSLMKVREINPKILAPGHGSPIKRWDDLVERVILAHEALPERIEAFLREHKKVKLGRLAEEIYPKAMGPMLVLSINLVRGILARMEREGRVLISEEYLVRLAD
ncbi:MAG: MBL fold metallo-hydrolase [Deltaproteobacteria bacterium]|uniref:MBL fold metallo-hydrolase n=1 Tax=Candidatus Zymogenus saltonus TaxID=2844893 RepID=A0A9D8PPI3_9DELT|nr:MBL fold metallo-hydrolase [Candidatus Zymogenus saltonus]